MLQPHEENSSKFYWVNYSQLESCSTIALHNTYEIYQSTNVCLNSFSYLNHIAAIHVNDRFHYKIWNIETDHENVQNQHNDQKMEHAVGIL